EIVSTLEIGPLCNHVALVDTPRGAFAYLTVGGLDEVQVWTREAEPKRVARIPTGELPHGIWPAPDGSRVYVSLENGDAVQAIDTATNEIVATIGVGHLPQAIVYVPGVGAPERGSEALRDLSSIGRPEHLRLAPTEHAPAGARGNVVLNPLGQIDHLQVVAVGLEPENDYELTLASPANAASEAPVPLARAKANPAGAVVMQALGPLRKVAGASGGRERPASASAVRTVELRSVKEGRTVLVQARR
ncbi:MAG TPA: hypothetical protein VEA63_16715, partial [Opitutus sp.]|nr:hypothetical protein [Opitutus sp.]